MDFLDNMVIMQKGSNLEMMNYLLILAKLIFITYSGTLLGSFILSFIYNSKSRNGNNIYKLYAKDYINLITPNKIIAFGLGIVPFMSVIMLYAQLLHKSGSPVTGYLIIGFVIYIIGVFAAYAYKHSLQLSIILGDFSQESGIEEGDAHHYSNSLKRLKSKSGLWGIIFLFISLWIFVSASNLATDSVRWYFADIMNTLFYPSSLFILLNFISAGLAVTALAFIVKFFFWDKDTYHFTEEYARKAQKLNASLALLFTLIQPIFIVLNLITTPKEAISYFMFGASLIVLLLAFAASHTIYTILKNGKIGFSTISFYLVLILFFFIVIKEQSAFAVSNKQQFAVLAEEYEQAEIARLEAMGKSMELINGEELYKVKCTACHQFDQKLIGPPHKEVLSKYIGKKEELVKFLMNPVKIDPNYPAMPNQALKTKEAEALADYMFEHYGPMLEK